MDYKEMKNLSDNYGISSIDAYKNQASKKVRLTNIDKSLTTHKEE